MKIEKEIKRIIKKSDNIFVSGHKDLDLDAIGACVGIKSIARHFKKECYIIIDDKEHSLSINKVLDDLKDNTKIITSDEITDLFKKNSVLIIVDTNKTFMIQNDKILHYFNDIIVIDHHQESSQTINGINIIKENKSSACEMIVDLMNEYDVIPDALEATLVLSGIILDTDNFIKKTSSNTYYAAYLLTGVGADPKKVQYYLKEDIKDYIIRNKILMNVEVQDNYAIATAKEKEKYQKEDLAKVADTLLKFNDIKASFVIGNRKDDYLGISARSEGLVDVGYILEKLGGGGDIYNAACDMKNITIEDAKKELIKALKEE
ncbi:MAG: DHH family phosphoesterase [Bacilli bacterium]|nr:DHH family phosphoesterase [Bacilli bacterium]